jgi:hypothetical protein
MNKTSFLANLYPQAGSIPAEFDLHEKVTQTEYLIANGMDRCKRSPPRSVWRQKPAASVP